MLICIAETHVSFVTDHYTVTEGDHVEIIIEMDKELSFNETIYIMLSASNDTSSAG